MEVIDIGFSDLETTPLTLNEEKIENISASMEPEPSSSSKPSVNFGPGIELLMNDKNISSSHSTNVEMDDLDMLEKELNDASGISSGGSLGDNAKDINTAPPQEGGMAGGLANLFNFGSKAPAETVKLDSLGNDMNDSKLGAATMESVGNTKTWDGFTKVSDVPKTSSGPRLNEREKRRKKRAMLKKLDEWYEKGHVKNHTNFTMESDFDEVEDEYETLMEEKRKKDSIKLQGWWFTTIVSSLEYGNAVFDPFGLNLDGWGEQITEDIDSYEEIFGELHEKYKGGKMAPELSLLLRLGFSGAVLNITNKALSTATPGFNDVIKQSPELMKMFSDATVQSMSNQSPAMDFVSEMLNPDNKPNTSFGPPPPAMETKNSAPPQRQGMQFTQAPDNRPDIAMGRGAMFREQGVDISQQQENLQNQGRTRAQAPPRQPSAGGSQGPRPEMKGPQNVDLDGLLSGLKPREVNMNNTSNEGGESMVSVSSLKEAQSNVLPKKTKRKQKSDKNTISLDI